MMVNDYFNNDLYSNYTRTLHDELIDDPSLLDGLKVYNTDGSVNNTRTTVFKQVFIALWDTYELGAETRELFKLYINNTNTMYSKYYSEIISIYEENNNISLDDLLSTNMTNSFIELPNSQTSSEYITNKNITDTKDKSTLIRKRKELLNGVRNIYLEFAYQFKECFCQMFDSINIYKI